MDRRKFLTGLLTVGALAPLIIPAKKLLTIADLIEETPKGPGAPWILCDGRSLETAKYPELFQALRMYTPKILTDPPTFQIPDLRNRYKLEYWWQNDKHVTPLAGHVHSFMLSKPFSAEYQGEGYLGPHPHSYNVPIGFIAEYFIQYGA